MPEAVTSAGSSTDSAAAGPGPAGLAPEGLALAGPVALVVEDDDGVRDLASAVLEESDLGVIACASAEAALSVLERGVPVAMVFADIGLAGTMDGVALAQTVERRWPDVRLVITSGGNGARAEHLPSQAVFLAKPWRALDVLVQAERATLAARHAA